MQQAMAALNEENRRLGLPELAMGIGVHVGQVVAGNIGSRERVKYGVVGSAVNLTARIQAVAARGEVLLSSAIAARVRGAVRLGRLRRMRAKGFAHFVKMVPLEGLEAADAADSRGVSAPRRLARVGAEVVW